MPNCYPCTVAITYHDPDAIGVCVICNNLACAGHGGRVLGVPQFKCGTCITGICTISSGGPNPPPPPPPGGLPVGDPQPPDQPGGQGIRFSSSLDFEIQLPLLARVSTRWRREIFRESLYESLRRLFTLLRDDDGARAEFLTRARETLQEPVAVRAQEQIAQSDRLGPVFDGRARGQHIGRPKALDAKNASLAQRMHASGEPASTIASTLGVSRATVYRVLAEQPG